MAACIVKWAWFSQSAEGPIQSQDSVVGWIFALIFHPVGHDILLMSKQPDYANGFCLH